MTRATRFCGLAFLAVVLLAAFSVMFTVATANAQTVAQIDVVMNFRDLRVGVPRTVDYSIDIPVDARVVRSEFVESTGVAQQVAWTVELCGVNGCRQLTEQAVGSPVRPGTYELRVTGVLQAEVVGDGRAVGVVQFVEASELASTGTTVVRAVGFVAASAVVIGAIGLAASRRANAS